MTSNVVWAGVMAFSAVQLTVVCVLNFSSACSTVSCATDAGELADRLSTQALTLQAVATYYAWQYVQLPTAFAVSDTLALLILAIVSSDVAGDLHNYVALLFVTQRILVTFSVSDGSLPLDRLYMLVLLRSLSLIFLGGYACPVVIPTLCETLSTPILPPILVLLTELGVALSGVGFLFLDLVKPPVAWAADRLTVCAFGVAVVLHLTVIIAKFSTGTLAFMLLASFMDSVLAWRLWKVSSTQWYDIRSLPMCVVLVLTPMWLVLG